jgi:hypothetical protein
MQSAQCQHSRLAETDAYASGLAWCSAGAGRAITAGARVAGGCAATTGAAASDESSMHRLPNFTLVRTPPVCVGASNVTGCWHVFLASATRGIFLSVFGWGPDFLRFT